MPVITGTLKDSKGKEIEVQIVQDDESPEYTIYYNHVKLSSGEELDAVMQKAQEHIDKYKLK